MSWRCSRNIAQSAPRRATSSSGSPPMGVFGISIVANQCGEKGSQSKASTCCFPGTIAISVDRGLGPRKVDEWRGGDVSGLLPYSRMPAAPGDTIIGEPTDVFVVDRVHFPELTRECPTITAALVHVMLDRARTFTSSELIDEKMMTLGRMSAGLAHELNNPASAVARSAKLLTETLAEAEDTSRAIGAARLTQAQFEAIDRVRIGCSTAAPSALTPIERADREEALTAWLEAHDANPNAAASLVDTGTSVEALDTLASAVQATRPRHGDSVDRHRMHLAHSRLRHREGCCARARSRGRDQALHVHGSAADAGGDRPLPGAS